MTSEAEQQLTPSLDELVNTDTLRWIFVGGKGGVGKTTTACSVALELTKRRENVLILSTDPAHNLSDAFCQKFSSTPSLVQGADNLYAMELSTTSHENVGFKIGSDSSLTKLLPDLLASFPGIDEALGFAELMQSVQAMKFSVIVFDTAPTGHTLRLLGFPALLDKALAQFALLKGKMEGAMKMVNMVANQEINEEDLSSKLDHIRAVTTFVRETFVDPTKTTFVCVCIPEFLSVYETERLVQELVKQKIDCSNVVVNQVLFPIGSDCKEVIIPPPAAREESENLSALAEENELLREALANLSAKLNLFEGSYKSRRKMQSKYIRHIAALYAEGFHVVCMPLQQKEVRGLEDLRSFGSMLMNPKPLPQNDL